MKPLPQWARRLQRDVEQATTCRTCGKKTLVAAVATGRTVQRLERVTRSTHCACAGGPAEGMPA